VCEGEDEGEAATASELSGQDGVGECEEEEEGGDWKGEDKEVTAARDWETGSI